MTLTSSLLKSLTSSLSQSLIPTVAAEDGLTVPNTVNLEAHVAAFQSGLTKAQLVNVDGGDLVEDWFGITSTSFDASQLTGSRQPLYTASAINSNPAIDFDGSGDLLNFGASIFDPSTTDFTIFAVVQYNNNVATKTVISAIATGENLINTSTDTSWRTTIGAGSIITAFSTSPTILTLRYLSGTLQLSANGVRVAQAKTPLSVTTDWLIGARSTGGNDPADGFVGEILVYSDGKSDSDRDEIEEYCSDKWGIALP